jgi:hypothetical protein
MARVLPAGITVRVVMASRFGDLGITEALHRGHGYDARVNADQLMDFREEA